MALCEDQFGNVFECNNSSWNNWGRWVALVVILVTAFLIFFLFACLSARRRRAHGLQPYRGTGWIPGAHGPAVYNPNYQGPPPQQPYYASSPPTYTPQAGGYYGQQNQGYFGGQQTGVELQQPSNAYRGGDNVYEPPTGPPPSKK